MINGSLLRLNPSELKFPFQLRKHSYCCLQVTNKIDQHVVFRIQTTNPKKYSVRPSCAVIKPRSTCFIKLALSAPSESPANMHCKDRFLIQVMLADEGMLANSITPELFINAPDKIVEEFKLRVIYVPTNPPSEIPEDSENEAQKSSLLDAASRSSEEPFPGKVAEASATIEKLIKEKNYVIQQNEELWQEIEDLRKSSSSSSSTDGYSFLFVLLATLLGIVFGYYSFK